MSRAPGERESIPEAWPRLDAFTPDAWRDKPRLQRRARLVVVVCWGTAALIAVALAVRLSLAEMPALNFLTLSGVAVVLTATPWLVRISRRPDVVVAGATVVLFVGYTVVAYRGGGLASPMLPAFVVLPAIATFLVHRRAGVWTTALVLAVLAFFAVLRQVGAPLPSMSLGEAWPEIQGLVVGAVTLALGLFAGYFDEVSQRAEEQLRAAQKFRKAADRRRVNFFADMSHEIRTPMNGVVGVTELLLGLDLSDQARRYVKTIEASAENLLRVLDDVLDFSKIEAGRLSLIEEELELRELVQGVMDLFAPRATERGVELVTRVEDSLPQMVRSDPGRLRQVLVNLLSNAVKFTSEGSIELLVSEADRGESSVSVRFAVRDTGIGMSELDLKRLFRPFTQVEGTAGRFGGTGLGLTISQRLVGLLGGRITVESEPGKGSTFTFTVPLAIPEAAGRRKVGSTTAESVRRWSRGTRVLLADDEPVNRMVAVRQLEKLGFEVDSVADGQEALEALERQDYAILLLDCQMPRLDGYETCRQLRRAGQVLPVIAVTASALQEDRQKCFDVGMDAHLTKPYRERELARVLKRFVSPESES